MTEKWYGAFGRYSGPTGKVQIEDKLRDAIYPRTQADIFTLPEPVLRLAQAEYDRQFPGQPYERMQERGGLGVLEVVALLADYVERLGGEPSKPRRAEPSTPSPTEETE